MHILSDKEDLILKVAPINHDGDFATLQYNSFDVTIFTTDSTIEPQFSIFDIDENGMVHVPYTMLQKLEDGQISVKIEYSLINSYFEDNSYDNSLIRHTNFLLERKNRE